MGDFSQTTFLGSSIVSFNATQGFNGQQSSLTVTLADDDQNGDRFDPVAVGQPATCSFGAFSFRGILQSYSAKYSSSGNPIYECILIDPTELLDGVQIITGGYASAVSAVPNLYNVYGYLESAGFGNSLINESGIKWAMLVNAFISLVSSSPILFRGYAYYLDLSSLPSVPDDFRLGGSGNMTALELISEICSTASHDFFFRLNGDIITLHTINRSNQPNFGLIAYYVSTTPGASDKSIGRELRNEFTSKFLVGGPIERLWYGIAPDISDNDIVGNEDDAVIWPYWGFDINGKPIIGKGLDYQHNFKLDARTLEMPAIGDEYHTDVEELSMVAESIDAWQSFLWIKNSDNNSIHFKKAERLKIISNTMKNVKGFLDGKTLDEVKNMTPKEFAAATKKDITDDAGRRLEEDHERLYSALRSFADEFYGVKFMVRLPNIQVKRVPDTNNLILSDEPTTSGFLPEEQWVQAIGHGLLPYDVNRMLDSDGKIVAYVKFTNFDRWAYYELSPDDYIKSGTDVFIACTVEEGIIYADPARLSDPRAVITLPAPIYVRTDEAKIGGLFFDFISERLSTLGVTDEADREEIIENIYKRAGGESLLFGKQPLRVMPHLAAVPLRSNILTYGPWYSVGANGKTEYENDPSLTPWNYGGWAEMNAAAQAKVTAVLSNNQEEESGTVSVPGSPDRNMGDQLIDGGPYITDINVSIDPSQGVLTTYNMRTWSPRLDKLANVISEKIRLAGKTMQSQRRFARDVLLHSKKQSKAKRGRVSRRERAAGRKPESSTQLIMGEVIKDGDATKPTHNVAMAPIHDLRGKVTTQNWDKKVIMSLEGLLRPFGINEGDEFSSFEQPEVGATTPNSVTLNPFKQGHDIKIVTQGDTVPDDGVYTENHYDDIVRAFALRGPLVMTGWGYDTAGKPVPNSNPNSPTAQFDSDYLSDPSLWKTGPVDIRWDHNRKVWVAGGGDTIKLVRITGTLMPGQTTTAITLELDGSTYQDADVISITDPTYSVCALQGEKLMAKMRSDGAYEPIPEYGLVRRGIAVGDIEVNTSGLVEIKEDSSNPRVNAYFNLFDDDTDISDGNDVLIKFNRLGQVWEIIGAECEGESFFEY